jgi:dynein heavy chain 2, cytosolic
VINLLGKKV